MSDCENSNENVQNRRVSEKKAANSGIRLVFVFFGLICIIQATLNIGLRLYLYIDPKCENVIAERDQLRSQYSVLQTSHQILSEEQNELKHQLQNMDLKHKWLYNNRSFYLNSTSELSWQDSREYCQKRGADLIVINTQEEQEFVRRFAPRIWIGLTDREHEGVWKWVDGSNLTRSFWSPGEPNDVGDNEDCVELIFRLNWNDLPCETRRHFICEFVLV